MIPHLLVTLSFSELDKLRIGERVVVVLDDGLDPIMFAADQNGNEAEVRRIWVEGGPDLDSIGRVN
jgi:hypothetical protein